MSLPEVLRVSDVTVTRGPRTILGPVTFAISPGERWVILGPNGAGKSTLLNILATRSFPTSGTITVLEKEMGKVDLFELRTRIGLVGVGISEDIPYEEKVRDVVVTAASLLVFTLLLADFFDTMGTMTALGNQAGLVDKSGNVAGANRILIVDSIAAATGGAAGVSSNTSYIESAAGVGEGARTGLASIVTGVAFLLTTFLAPLVAMIPYEAATPALIIVGFLMMGQVKNIEWDDLGIGIPAFLTIILMPFTYNISVGIGAGFITHVVIRLVQGRVKEVHPLLLLVSGLFMVYFLQSPINALIG